MELMLVVAAVVFMVKVADAENKSCWFWGALTLGLCVLSGTLPLPYLRILIATIISFVIMVVQNLLAKD